MRSFIGMALILGVGIGIAGLAFGWFEFSRSPSDGKSDLALTVGPDKINQNWHTVLGVLQPSPKDQKSEITTENDKRSKDRDEFQLQAETQFKATDRSLGELRAKAKNGHAVTKECMNEMIDDLTKKTKAARQELRELKIATQEQWDLLKARVSASLEQLKDGIERAFARFMNEWTHSAHDRTRLTG